MDQTRRSGPYPEAAPTEPDEAHGTPRGYGSSLSGIPMPASDMAPDALIAFGMGFCAGWQHGEQQGRADGYRRADEMLRSAVAAALGNPGDDFPAAVRRLNRTAAVLDYRRDLAERHREGA